MGGDIAAGMGHLSSLVCALLITACPAATTPVLASHGVQYDSLSPSRLSFGRAVDIEDETLTEGSDPSARMESAVAGEAAILIIEFNPSMVLYRGETITIELPGFTACGIASRMTASCALHNSQTGNQELGSAFGARWSADREQVELKLNTDLLDPAPVRLELTGGITIPEAGIVNPINVTMVADLSSQERPKCCAKGDPPACCPWRFLDPASAACCGWDPHVERETLNTLVDVLEPVGGMQQLQVAFDSMAVPGQPVSIDLQFRPTFKLVAGDVVLFHLPAFGGIELSDIQLTGSSGPLFSANWTASPAAASAAAATSIKAADPRLLQATEDSWINPVAGTSAGGSVLEGSVVVLRVLQDIDALELLQVSVPEAAGITLPIGGVCSWAEHAELLIEVWAELGPVAPVSIQKHGDSTITTSYDCTGDPVLFEVPQLVHLGHDIRVNWRRTKLEDLKRHIHHMADGSHDLPQDVMSNGASPSHPAAAGSSTSRIDLQLEFGTHSHDYIGLFEVGSCRQPESVLQDDGVTVQDEEGALGQWQNRCLIASQTVVRDGSQQGQSEGHVMFYYTDYQKAGEYEVRYFKGDSPAGNGLVCRGLPSLLYSSHSGASVQCVLEAAAHSSTISVQASPNKAKCVGVPTGPDIYRC